MLAQFAPMKDNAKIYHSLTEGVSRASVALAYFSKPEPLAIVKVALIDAIAQLEKALEAMGDE